MFKKIGHLDVLQQVSLMSYQKLQEISVVKKFFPNIYLIKLIYVLI